MSRDDLNPFIWREGRTAHRPEPEVIDQLEDQEWAWEEGVDAVLAALNLKDLEDKALAAILYLMEGPVTDEEKVLIQMGIDGMRLAIAKVKEQFA